MLSPEGMFRLRAALGLTPRVQAVDGWRQKVRSRIKEEGVKTAGRKDSCFQYRMK